MSYDAPFAGLKVVDLSQGIAGPYSAMLLAQYGADVIKVEPPEGDWARALGKRYGDLTAFAVAANLGKRSIVLDLKTDEGHATVRRLAATADVFMESFRPGVAARLGIGYAEVAAGNPRVVYLSVSGFGQSGPDAERPAVDTVFQAFTGIMSVNRGPADGIPHRVPVIVMDMATALCSFQALATALYARRDEARGRYIESSLLRGGATLQAVSMIQHHLEGGKPQPGLTPSGTFRASDGWINITILRDAEFPVLCEALGVPAVGTDARFATNDLRFANLAALTALLEPAFAGRTTAELSARLRAARLMHQRVNTYLEFLDDPQVKATGAVAWIEQPGIGRVPVPQVPGLPPLQSGTPRAVAPSLDQHRKEILAELGSSM
jgi:crotonobetainyl-CoA:carnitine CoA-transferase CaiB-like acyl-CoA transferase